MKFAALFNCTILQTKQVEKFSPSCSREIYTTQQEKSLKFNQKKYLTQWQTDKLHSQVFNNTWQGEDQHKAELLLETKRKFDRVSRILSQFPGIYVFAFSE